MSKNRILSLVLALVMVLGAFGTVFADTVSPAKTQVEAAAFLKDKGVLAGNAAGDLMLEQELRRRDSVILFSKLLGEFDVAKEFAGEPTYTDIKKEDGSFKDPAYVPFLKWGQENEHYVGKPNGEFGWDANLTAQEYSVVLLKSLGYTVNGEGSDVKWEEATKKAADLGVFKGFEKVEETKGLLRGEMALMTFNALGIKIKGTEQTLAAKLGIELPEADKAKTLEAKVLDTENLAEVVVELSNADLVKSKDALLNPANYRFNKDEVKVHHVHLDGDNVVLTLIPYGKIDDVKASDIKPLIKGKEYTLTIRNIDNAINKEYRGIKALDNAIPEVEKVEFMGDYGIKVTTTEPIANPLERNFRLDSRTSMIVEQYGRDIILTPYHGKAFAKDTTELTIDQLEDFAGYKSAKTLEKLELSKDEALPKVTAAYRSGKKVVVEFDRDIYHDSVKEYKNRRELGNISFTEKRVDFYAKEANKVDVNVVEYTFEREVPKGTEVVVEGVANHFNKAMEKETVVAKDFRDENAPVIIKSPEVVRIIADQEAKFAGLGEEKSKEYQAFLNSDENEFNTKAMEIVFDKDIYEFDKMSIADLNAAIKKGDFFTLYELDITTRGRNAAKNVEITAEFVKDSKNVIQKDRIKLTFKNIKVNNLDRDYDYVLEVRNFTDLSVNRMDREYLDFQVKRNTDPFDVKEIKIYDNNKYFNRNGIEIRIELNNYVDKAEAQIAKNYYLDGNLDVDEAIVERDGYTVSLVVYDYETVSAFLKDYKVLEISPRVTKLDNSSVSVARRFWDLTKNPVEAINDPAAVKTAEKALANAIVELEKIETIALKDEAVVEAARKAVDTAKKLGVNVDAEEVKVKAAEDAIKALKGLVEDEAAAKKLAEATEAVVIAEATINQTHVNAAKELVEKLPADVAPDTTKATLLGRLAAVQKKIDSAAAKVVIDGKTVDVAHDKGADVPTVLAAIKALAADNDVIKELVVGDVAISGTKATVTLDTGITAEVTINVLPLPTYKVTVVGDAVVTADYTIVGVPLVTDYAKVDEGTKLTITAVTDIEVNGFSLATAGTLDIMVTKDTTITINKAQ